MDEQRIQSPHAALQSMLPRLSTLGPSADWRPVFRERGHAERLIAIADQIDGRDLHLSPIWAVNHDDLTGSQIVAWTVGEDVN